MARVSDSHASALPGQIAMPRTVQCPECGVVLNVPPAAAGRRLKCPKCETRFADPGADSPSSSTFPAMNGSSAASSMYAPRQGGSSGEFDLPTSPVPLRETFDLPLLSDLGPTTAPKAPVSDAHALFQDEPKSARRPTKGAEARSQARRCPTCGGVVPIGMSLCSRCGLDLDTGMRVDTLEVFDEEMPTAPRSDTFPMGVAIVGGVSALASVLLAVISLVAWTNGRDGAQFLLAICLFGLFASIQFLRRRSIRLLVVALSLGVLVDVLALIALPVYNANVAGSTVVEAPGDSADPDDVTDGPRIRSIEEKLDMEKITWGVALMLTYAALAVYLNSPPLRRQFARR